MKNAADLALEKAKISAKETRKQAPSSRRRSPPVDQREANEDMMMMTVEEAIGSSVFNQKTHSYEQNNNGHITTFTSLSTAPSVFHNGQIYHAHYGLKGLEGVTADQMNKHALDSFGAMSYRAYGIKGGYKGDPNRLHLYKGDAKRAKFAAMQQTVPQPPFATKEWQDQSVVDPSSGETRKATNQDFEALFGLWTDGLSAHIDGLDSDSKKEAAEEAKKAACKEIVEVQCCDNPNINRLKGYIFMTQEILDTF
ncbi:hypothetical protein TrRE_jg6666 [Triparma retinervis]|uniref:Uncharacterized protein n=1 Tax=Triparma retinervis TaxID=2557542 RepID=A0A9W6ZN94_9STRA|nr:hypothetical protein TrRE_jg6666 [Triparma retinervis]